MASDDKIFTKSGEPRYVVRYRDPKGRSREKWFDRQADARRYKATVEADKARGSYVDPRLANTTLTEFSERWQRTTVHLKPKTREGYESLLSNHILPVFGEMRLGSLDNMAIRDWVSELDSRLSPSRVRQAYRVLASILKLAVESGYLVKSPCIGISLPRLPEPKVRFLSPDEVNRLADSIAKPYDTLVLLLAYGGIRFGEAAALRKRHCHLLRSQLEIAESLSRSKGAVEFGPTKNHQIRSIVLPDFLKDRLARHLAFETGPAPDALVFTSPGGAPLHSSNFHRRVWRPAVIDAGFDGLHPHDLRHTCVAMLISKGGHPEAIKRHLGHKHITTTMDTYGHLFPSDAEQLAVRMDELFDEAGTGRVGFWWGSRGVEPPTASDGAG